MHILELNIREQVTLDARVEEGGDQLRFKIQQHTVKCRHYSPHVRKDAYGSLLKIFKELNEADASRMLSLLSEPITKAFIDEDEQARGMALGLAQNLLKRLDESVLSAFFPGWMQFCMLSLTHIEPAIRRDGMVFISIALESKPSLMIPFLVKVLQAATPGLAPKSAKPLKKGLQSETEVVFSAIKLYAETAMTKTDTRVYPDYTWSAVQTASLRIVRSAPKTSGLELIDPVLLRTIIEKSLGAMSDGWLALADQVNSGHLTEDTAPTRSQICYLRDLVKALDVDQETFWSAIPRAMMNVLGKGGRQKLEHALTQPIRHKR